MSKCKRSCATFGPTAKSPWAKSFVVKHCKVCVTSYERVFMASVPPHTSPMRQSRCKKYTVVGQLKAIAHSS